MKKYTVSIPAPCKASMQNMTPVIGGKFCSSCQKQVVDFTNMTDQQMVDYFKRHDHVCGSFLPSQLNRELIVPSTRRWVPAAFLAGMLALIAPASGQAQFKITGKVIEASDNTPIPFASVYLLDQHGKPMKIGAVSKEDGSFSFEVPAEFEKGVRLQVSFVGYEIKTIRISGKKLKAQQPVNCTLKMNMMVLGGVAFEERTAWQRLKSRFFG